MAAGDLQHDSFTLEPIPGELWQQVGELVVLGVQTTSAASSVKALAYRLKVGDTLTAQKQAFFRAPLPYTAKFDGWSRFGQAAAAYGSEAYHVNKEFLNQGIFSNNASSTK